MMEIVTIDYYFDHQMKNAIKAVLADHEKTPGDFESGDDLLSFLWSERKDFGELVLNQMTEWQSEDEWLDKILD